MSSPADITAHPASYRDPAGFIFERNGVFYRQVNACYKLSYDTLIQSKLYDTLTKKNLLLPHSEEAAPPTGADPATASPDHYLTLLPRQLSTLSYPTEWSPDQLKDAALLTLQIQLLAITHGMTLKDATAYNIQFENGRPIFIDTLSFDIYDPEKPWIAYRQFCECFLFPLYIHQYAQTGAHKIAQAWPDGIPVATTARLLPFKSRWNTGAWLHVFLQNKVTATQTTTKNTALRFSKTKLTQLIEHLHTLVSRIVPAATTPSAWNNYYTDTILSTTYLHNKENLFRQYLEPLEFANALDLGCNDGLFSKILAEKERPVIAVDADWQCVQRLYRDQNPNILPLCIDLSNPTPATGFRNAERSSFNERATSDLVTALALVHHLALHHNIPLNGIADYFSLLTKKFLLIEFIPLSDEKAKALIARKETPAVTYDIGNFEKAFSRDFRIEKKDLIPGTERILYLLAKS